MKIGIDIDNTITSTIPVLRESCIKYNNEVVKRNLTINEYGFAASNFFEWTNKELMDFCSKHLEDIVLSAPIKNNAREIIKKLKEENYIYIITARKKPYFSDPYKLTKKFLDKNDIVYNELIVECQDKYKFCVENNINVMIDDEPQNINSISKVMPVIVFDGTQNSMCKGNNILKVNTWDEVYNIIKKIVDRKNKLDR